MAPSSDEVTIERVRLRVLNAHVFKLPPKPSAGGWRGAEWRDKVWQGTLQVVERGDETAVLLVDAQVEKNIFAVCPIKHPDPGSNGGGDGDAGNGVDRCVDSSRYFVLKIQNGTGRSMYIGLAFNERNDAFDFNAALEDIKREKEAEAKGVGDVVKRTGADYRMKEGESMRVSIPGKANYYSESSPGGQQMENNVTTSAAVRRREERKARQGSSGDASSGGFLKPSSRDTPSRIKS